MQSVKQNIQEISMNFNEFWELYDNGNEFHLNLKQFTVDNVKFWKILEGKSIKLNLPDDKELDEFEGNKFVIFSSLQEKYLNDQLMVYNSNMLNDPAIYKELLLMTLNIVSNISNGYRQRLIKDGFHNREINTMTFPIQILTILINIFNQNRLLDFEKKTISAIAETKLEKIFECLNYLENRVVTNEKYIFSLSKDLENAKRELEFIILCQERGISRPGDDERFTENIELSLYKKELETLRKSFIEMECINTSLEQKLVNLLNDKNSLISKNALLEDQIFSKKKIIQKKNNNNERINITKQMNSCLVTTKFAKNDLILQIKEQAEIINNMALHNTQLNAFIEKLKEENKICTQTHILFRRVITEKEIQYLKLDHSLKNFKIINYQLEIELNAKDKLIEKLETQLNISENKIDQLCSELNLSESIRIAQTAELRRVAKLITNITSSAAETSGGMFTFTEDIASGLVNFLKSEESSMPNIILTSFNDRKTSLSRLTESSSSDTSFIITDNGYYDNLHCQNIHDLDPVIIELEEGKSSTLINSNSSSNTVTTTEIGKIQKENQVQVSN